eukprot:Pgem_evm1s19703
MVIRDSVSCFSILSKAYETDRQSHMLDDYTEASLLAQVNSRKPFYSKDRKPEQEIYRATYKK